MQSTQREEAMRQVLVQLRGAYEELQGVKIKLPDYTTKGLSELYYCFEAIVAFAARGASLNSEAIRLTATARVLVTKERAAYQNAYDAIVASVVMLHGDKSWEERGSVSRTKVLDEAMHLRKCEEIFILIEAYRDAITNLARHIQSMRRDMDRLGDIVRLGSSLQEL